MYLFKNIEFDRIFNVIVYNCCKRKSTNHYSFNHYISLLQWNIYSNTDKCFRIYEL